MSNLTDLAHDPRYDATRVIRAPRGTQRVCKSWLTEAAYRMIQNNLDPGRRREPASTSWSTAASAARRATGHCFDRILAALKDLERRRVAADPVGQAGRRASRRTRTRRAC